VATPLKQQLEDLVERKSTATGLGNLIQGYRFYARTEGKSLNTITLTTTALAFLMQFLEANGLATDVILAGITELRRFILHLQGRRAWSDHACIQPRTRGLSGHSVNCCLRSIRAFWSWLVSEEHSTNQPLEQGEDS